MTPQEYVYSRLAGDPAVSALVGTRISPGVSKQRESNPRIRLLCFGARPEQTQDGEQDMRDQIVQLDCIGNDYDSARAVSTAALAALRASDSPVAGLFFLVENDGLDIPEPDDDEHRVMCEVRFWHR